LCIFLRRATTIGGRLQQHAWWLRPAPLLAGRAGAQLNQSINQSITQDQSRRSSQLPNAMIAGDAVTCLFSSFETVTGTHPTHLTQGERWMKNVYEALRNGPQWNQTLLIITYDEHGGAQASLKPHHHITRLDE
jgi:hypothetical protein